MPVVLVGVALVLFMHVPRLVAVVFVGVALVLFMLVVVSVVFVGVALVLFMHVPRLVAVVFVGVALVLVMSAHAISPFESGAFSCRLQARANLFFFFWVRFLASRWPTWWFSVQPANDVSAWMVMWLMSKL